MKQKLYNLKMQILRDLSIKDDLKTDLSKQILQIEKEVAINYTRCCETFTPTEILEVLDDCNSVNDAKQYYLDENI